MKFGLKFVAASAVSFVMTVSAAAAATYTYVGNWDVYYATAPEWAAYPPDGPLAYTGQEAAALLFGGVASDYVISTIDEMVANINNMAWYDVIGYGQLAAAEGYSNKHLGLYYGPTGTYDFGNPDNAASAFIRDNLEGLGAINYAFRVAAVPVPASLPLLAVGLGIIGFVGRKKRKS